VVCVLMDCEWDCGNSKDSLLPPKECVLNFDGVGLVMTNQSVYGRRMTYSIIEGQLELTLIRRCNMFECINRIGGTKQEHSILGIKYGIGIRIYDSCR